MRGRQGVGCSAAAGTVAAPPPPPPFLALLPLSYFPNAQLPSHASTHTHTPACLPAPPACACRSSNPAERVQAARLAATVNWFKAAIYCYEATLQDQALLGEALGFYRCGLCGVGDARQ